MPGFLVGPRSGFVDRMKGKGMCSSGFLQQIGNSTALSAGGGCVFSNLSAAGAGNGADSTDDTLMSCSLPANIMDIAGRCVVIQAWGTVLATSTTKTIKFKWGASALVQLAQYTTTAAGGWMLTATIYKISANVQGIVLQMDASGATTTFTLSTGRALTYSAGSEVDTAAIPVVVTGSAANSGANLVLCNGMIVDAYN